MVQIREENLISLFEESFKDEVQRIYDESSLTSFVGRKYSMEYNFLEGYISISRESKRIGAVFISDDDIFSKIDTSSYFMLYIGLFELNLKKLIKSNEKLIESNKRKTRRKFLAK